MKTFFIKIFCFALPLSLFVTPAFYKLFTTKENFYNVDEAIGNFDNQKYLIGYLYDESDYRYIKYKTLSQKKATVVALGSSRVLPFRKEMFDADFYNAGFAIENVQDFKVFLSCLPEENLPNYLILGLDQWMFNDNWNNLTVQSKFHWMRNNTFTAGEGIKITTSLYPDWAKGRLNETQQTGAYSSNVQPIGLNAIMHSTGFRNDGSVYYGELVQKLSRQDTSVSDYNFRNTFKRIREGNERFQYGDQVSEKALRILDELLLYCKAHRIQVIGFVPPFADAVYAKMKETGKYNYVESLEPALRPIFEKYNYELHCYHNVSAIGSNDSQTTDGFHGGEKTYLKILVNMMRNKSALNKVSNLEKRELEMNAIADNYVVYPY